MLLTRRALLASLTAAFACPALADDAPLAQLLRDVALNSDLAAMADRLVRLAGLPERTRRGLAEQLAELPTDGGALAVRALSDDRARLTQLRGWLDRERRRPSVLLRARKLARRAPTSAAERQALLDLIFTEVAQLDMAHLRAEAAALPPGLLVVVGPSIRQYELLGAIAREPFIRFLEFTHGYRATEWVAGRDDERLLLKHLLDPALPVACFLGHGEWSSFSLAGYNVSPDAGFARLCVRLRDNPAETINQLVGSRGWTLFGASRAGTLEETDLAALVAALPPTDTPRKRLVVRYTCGYDRYYGGPKLLWPMLPPELRRSIVIRKNGFGSRAPANTGQWEAEAAAWFAPMQVDLHERPALGTCLVADPHDTRGYEGQSWLPDFLTDPIPAWVPPLAGTRPAHAPQEPK